MRKLGLEYANKNSNLEYQISQQKQEIEKLNHKIADLTQQNIELSSYKDKFASTQQDLVSLQHMYEKTKVALDAALTENKEYKAQVEQLNEELNQRVFEHTQEVNKLKQLPAFENDEEQDQTVHFKVQPVLPISDEDIFDREQLPEPEQ